jgi:ADP-ribose pyrophosphatase
MRKRDNVMPDRRKLADLPADIAVTAPELLAEGYCDYRRYRMTLQGADGAPVTQERDILIAGKVVAVLPVDLARDEIVLIRQFRLPAHLANGRGDLLEVVAGRVEPNETLLEAARRECGEEIGVTPGKLIEMCNYLTTPGVTDEEVTIYLAAVDASQVKEGAHATTDGEQLHILRVPIDDALAALAGGAMRGSPIVIALQWLGLNRHRLAVLLGA